MKELIHSIAWSAIEKGVKDRIRWEPEIELKRYKGMREKQGAFTTLYTGSREDKRLRGCIGIPRPVIPLGIAIARSAYGAALEDPRFDTVTHDELQSLLMSCEVLSPLERIEYSSYDELVSKIGLGVDGLIIESGGLSGLLLPKVPIEYNWDVHTYLDHLCQKAMLSKSSINRSTTTIHRFTSQLYEYY